MKLLAIDTATEACSVALSVDGDIRQEYRVAPREHSHIVLPMIEQLLAEAELQPAALDAMAFGRGPGSFMGVRIAAGVVQGIAWAHELPVVPVSTLAALAWNAMQASSQSRVLTAIDARMQEVYWAAYEADAEGLPQLHIDEAVLPPDQVSLPKTGSWLGAGSGWQSYADALQSRCNERVVGQLPDMFPSAEAIAAIAAPAFARGETVSAEAAVPVYLRDNVAKKSQKPLLPTG